MKKYFNLNNINIVLLLIVTLYAVFYFIAPLIKNIETITYDWRAKSFAYLVMNKRVESFYNITDKTFIENYKNSRKMDQREILKGYTSNNIMLVAVDDYSKSVLSNYPQLNLGRWPWPRKYTADVLNFVNKGNPKAVAFDFRFEGEDHSLFDGRTSDDYIVEAFKKSEKILIGLPLRPSRRHIFSLTSKEQVIDSCKRMKFDKDWFDGHIKIFKKNGMSEQSIEEFKQIVANDKYQNDELDKVLILLSNLKTPSLPEKFNIDLNDDDISNISIKDQKINKLLDNITYFSYSPIERSILNASGSIGSINIMSDETTIARYNVPFYKVYNGGKLTYVPSLPLAVVLSVIPEEERTPIIYKKNKIIVGKREIPVDDQGKVLINWNGPRETYPAVHISQLILTIAHNNGIIKNVPKTELLSSDIFKNKIVVVGETLTGGDMHPTPMDMIYPGPEIIMTAIDNYLIDADTTNPNRRKFITRMNWLVELIITLFFCSLIVFVSLKTKSHITSICVSVFIPILYISFAIAIFILPNVRIWISLIYPILIMIITSVGSNLYKIHIQDKDRRQIEGLFGRFISPQLLKQLLENPEGISQMGKRKNMTVMFTDIRGFTTLSEKTEPKELISQLNEYMSEMVEIIYLNEGTMDKFIGDAVMAFYGDPVEMEDHALKAVYTCLDMMDKLHELNAKWESEGKQPFNIGLGVNTGDMVVGHMGSPKLLDYTVLGDNVNLASRVESLNKTYHTNIIITEYTLEHVKNYIETKYLDEVLVKGKEIPVKIYEVIKRKTV